MKQIAVLFAVFAITFAADSSDVEKANQFVDETITNRGHELESIDIPAFPVTFKVPGGEAGVKLHGGNVTGLDGVKRTRESVVRDTVDDHRETTYYIGTKGVKLRALASYVFYYNYNINFDGKLDEMEVEIRILMNKQSKLQVVRYVKLTKFEGFDLKIDAPGIVVDKIVNLGLAASRIAYQPVVKYVIEKRIKSIVDKEIADRNQIVG